MRELLQGFERAVLQTIDFELNYSHPLKPILTFAGGVKGLSTETEAGTGTGAGTEKRQGQTHSHRHIHSNGPLALVHVRATCHAVVETGARCPNSVVQDAVNAMHELYATPLCLVHPAQVQARWGRWEGENTQTHTHAYTHACTHAYTHTHTHTYTHTHTLSLSL